MTIEEFDKKKDIRDKIEKIDRMLNEYKLREPCEGTRSAEFLGVGTSSWYLGTVSLYIEDEVLADRFKQLLLQRKQELIDEFSNG